MKRIIPLLILTLVIFNTYAQQKVKEIKIKEIEGIAIGGDMESIDQVIQRAIDEAKVEA